MQSPPRGLLLIFMVTVMMIPIGIDNPAERPLRDRPEQPQHRDGGLNVGLFHAVSPLSHSIFMPRN
jgi:hypothetical protein